MSQYYMWHYNSVTVYYVLSYNFSLYRFKFTSIRNSQNILHAKLSGLVFVSIRQRINFVIVEERVVAISPRKLLSSTTQMFVWDKVRSSVMLVMFLLLRHGVHVAEQNPRHSDRERQNLPQTQATLTPPSRS